MSPTSNSGLNRRSFLKAAGLGAAAIGGGSLLSACSGGLKGAGGSSSDVLKIGYVSPQTGPLAGFASADNFVVKDTQSNPNRATEVTRELINSDKVDLIVGSSTPDTTNPVADQCEANGVPCLSSLAPWQPFFFGRGGDPEAPFAWTYHFFWGLEDVTAVFTDMWNSIETNKTIGALWPNDPDGNAWGDPELGFLPPVTEAGCLEERATVQTAGGCRAHAGLLCRRWRHR